MTSSDVLSDYVIGHIYIFEVTSHDFKGPNLKPYYDFVTKWWVFTSRQSTFYFSPVFSVTSS